MDQLTSPPKDDVIIRRAQAEDYYDVMDIGVLFDGRDYLAFTYKQAVNDPDIYTVVAEVKGQVVGFYMKQIIDGGLSVIKRGARVHPSFRKMGIMHLMSEELDKHMTENDTNVKYMQIAVLDLAVNRVASEYRHLGYNEIHRKPVISFHHSVTELKITETEADLPHVIHLGYDDVKFLFTLHDVVARLFPNERLFNSFIGYRCLESNIKHFVGQNKAVFATVLSPSQRTNELKVSYHDMDMITFANWWVGGAGLIYSIDVYATEDRNKSSFIAHMRKHIEIIHRLKLADKGIIIAPLGDNISAEYVQLNMRCFGVNKVLTEVETMQVYYEKEIKFTYINH